MTRQVGDERARYARKGLREQLDDILSWPPAHPVATVVLLAFLVVGTLFFGSRALSVRAETLAVGDCLFVRTAAVQDEARPIGSERQAADVLLAGGAERTDCGASHGHEVSAIVTPALETLGPGASPRVLDATAMRALAEPLCEASFAGYVGRGLGDSRFTTFAVVPEAGGAEAWLESGRRTLCLVARRDGEWMEDPARGSGE